VTNQFAASAQTFHAKRSDALAGGFGQDMGFETAKCRIATVERHLNGVEGEIMGKHFQMNFRIFMPGKTDKTHLALLLGREQSFRGSIGSENQLWIILINDFMNLPEIEMIGLQATKRFFEQAIFLSRPWVQTFVITKT